MGPCLLALDQGTSSTRTFLLSTSGDIRFHNQRPLAIQTPKPGWVEQDPEIIWQDSLALITESLQQLGNQDRVVSMGLSNQRETTIVWERDTGKAIYPAIVWQDRRTAEICQTLKQEGLEPWIQNKTGLVLDPYFCALKIRWILDNVDGAQAKADKGKLCFGTVDSYLLWHLSQGRVHATDSTNASRTMLFNIHAMAWDEELCQHFNIPSAMLPQVLASDSHFCDLDVNLFDSSIAVNAVMGDQQSALIGQGCFEPGQLKTTFGTGCFMLMNVGEKPTPSKHQLLTTVGIHTQDKCHYALEGSLFTCGNLMAWLERLQLLSDASESERLARNALTSHNVLVLPALSGLGAPIWDADARGAIFGLGLDTNRETLVAAALEGLCFQTKLLVDTLERDSLLPLNSCKVDGGLCNNEWFLQTLSQCLSCDIHQPKQVETTVIGAAFLSGVSSAVTDWQAFESFNPLSKKRTPTQSEALNQRFERWMQALQKITSVDFNLQTQSFLKRDCS